jgi:mono/diheme cytochrome c family protein
MNLFSKPVAATIFALLLAMPAMADEDAPPVNPFSGDEAIVSEGRTIFNIHCSHCHGPNGIQGERPRDLRRLKRRYRDNVTAVFLTTAKNGRPEKGMPAWREILAEENLWKVFTFLETIQK